MAPRDQVRHDVTVEVACQAGQERFADRHQVCIRTKNGGRELGGSCKPSVLTTTDALHTFRLGLPRHAKRTSQGRISLIDRTPDRLAVIARLALADLDLYAAAPSAPGFPRCNGSDLAAGRENQLAQEGADVRSESSAHPRFRRS